MLALPFLLAALVFNFGATSKPKQVPPSLVNAAPSVTWIASSQLRGDFDFDGISDLAFLGRTKGRIFIGVAISSSPTPEVLEFEIDARKQAAICGEPARLTLEPLDYDPMPIVGVLEGFKQSKTALGLNLSGGDCDSIHVYWDYRAKHLSWWRL